MGWPQGLGRVCVLMGASAGLSSLARAEDSPRPNYAEDVASILDRNCASCHRPNEGAPFPLLTFRDAKKHGQLIRDVTTRHEMPPWPPTPGWGHFRDERRLSTEQIDTLARWVDSGMPEGPEDRRPPLPDFPKGGWALGTPDLVVELPEAFEVPADGRDINRMFVMPLNLTEDKWVSAVEILPTARSVVHHALYFLDSTGEARKIDEADPQPGFSRMGFPRTGSLGGWAVGATARHLPGGLAYPLAKGSDLIVQIHFHPSGKVEREKTRFGLYFAKQPPPKKLLGMQAPQAFGFGTALRTKGISPGDDDFTIRGEWTAPFDVDLVSVGGHAHYICKSMKAVATLPDGSEKNLFAIDDWDFNWQGRYNYAEPVRLPRGTVVKTTLVYDNSADNPKNPTDPPRQVRWGEGSFDEMGSVLFGYTAANEADLASYRGPSLTSDLLGGFRNTRPNGGAVGGGSAVANFRSMDADQMKSVFELLDVDKDGKLTGDEISSRMKPFLRFIDTNRDDAIDLDEMLKLRTGASTGDANAGGNGGATRSFFSVDAADPSPKVSDIDGKSWSPFDPTGDTKGFALFFVTPDCPLSNQFSPEIARLARDHRKRGIQPMIVHVDPDTTVDDARQHAREFGLGSIPIVLDPDHRVANRAGAKVTPEAALIAPGGKVAYKGRIDDRYRQVGHAQREPSTHDLADALGDLLAGRAVANPRAAAVGCPIVDRAEAAKAK